MLQLVIKFVFGTIEYFSLCLLSLSLFRFPIIQCWKKIACIALIVEAVSIYQREVLMINQHYAMLGMLIVYILLINILLNIPTFFAVIICFFGYVSFSIVQALLLMTVDYFQFTSFEKLTHSLKDIVIMQLITAVVNCSLVYWMSNRRIGFVFIEKRVVFNTGTRMANVLLLIVLLLSFGVILFAVVTFFQNESLMYVYLGIIILAIIALYITYQKNKKELLDHYNRLKDRNRSI
ncbi:hypothetical protein PV433_32940 [Paenibacillus sp. GYB004]|uniref:hypothetical protein n=1 Tax=Paenibacillus sp. GYB004 TaxID=2994393 RepID=UPI002F963F7C